MLSAAEVAIHNSRDSCWIIVSGEAYDVTDFLDQHPGGAAVILGYAGKDATEEYEPIHPPSALEDNLPSEKRLGKVDLSTLGAAQPRSVASGATPPQTKSGELPPLSQMISLLDFEEAGKNALTEKAWAYYHSGATDMACTFDLQRGQEECEIQIDCARATFASHVTRVDTSTTLAGSKVSVPFFIAPTGMAKLSHPRGEMCFSEGAGLENTIFTISTNASAGLDQIIESKARDDQPFFFQLYMNRDRLKSTALIRKVSSFQSQNSVRNVKAIVVTVDAPAPGKREADEKVKAAVVLDLGIAGGRGTAPDAKGGGIGRAMGGYIDPNVTWRDIAWIRDQVPSSSERMLVGVKGVQSVADVLHAISSGADIIWISNHGGRSLDTAPPALYVLLELQRDHPWVFDPAQNHGVEIIVDGGIRRGTDVVKALCLGARAVALGRPFMYALQYGTEGIQSAIQILRDEVETTMRLIGANSIADLGPHLINTKALQPLLNDPILVPASAVRAKL